MGNSSLRLVRRRIRSVIAYEINKLRRLIWKVQGKQFVHFLHIGKTGGSAVKEAIRPHRMAGKYIVFLHPHHVTLSDVPKGEKVVFFLRDPVARFVSGFYSRQRQGRPRYDSPWNPEEREAFATFQTPNELANALSSKDETQKEAAERAMRNIVHVKDHYWKWFRDKAYFCERMEDVLFVGMQEALDSDFAKLREILPLPSLATLPTDEVKSHRNPEGLDRDLDETALRNLRHWYQKDYEYIDLCRTHGKLSKEPQVLVHQI